MTTKHTPGPWSVRAASFADNGGINYEVNAPGIKACAADALLIEAAPDLLAALRGLIDMPGDIENADFNEQESLWQARRIAWQAAKDAIAKATGPRADATALAKRF